jgi:hypothetical protein
VLHVGLPTNFKAAVFEDEKHNRLLRELEADIDAVRLDGLDVPVKLKAFDSLFVPLAKWSMLLTGNYRERRDALVQTLATDVPEARIGGIAAGLHATVQLPDCDDEIVIRDEAARRGLAIGVSSEFYIAARGGPPTLLLGYARSSESVIRTGVRVLAAAISAARARGH